VFQIGASYKATDALTLRAGAKSPITGTRQLHECTVPATIKTHYTLGAGYAFSKVSEVNGSYTYAPEVSSTNSNMGYTTTHGQSNNWQLMYSHRF